MSRAVTPPIELKAYFRDLVTACGGPKRAAEITGGHASHISEAMAPHNSDRWPRLDHIALLEADCGHPIVTAALADRVGYAVEPVSAESNSKTPIAHLASMTSEFRDVEVGLINAMADGEITAAERRELGKQTQELIAALTNFRAFLIDPPSAGNITRITK